MSTAPLYPESKTENAIYVAFGTTLGLAIMKWYQPDIFSDVVTALAIALFLGSLIGSTLFYVKIEEVVDWILRRWILRRYGIEIKQFLASSHLAIETWRMRVTGNWESVETKSKTMLQRVTEGPDVHNEMWSLRGAFYFSLAVPLIMYVAGLQLEILIIISFLLLLVVMISVGNIHRNFLKRCSRIAMFRLIQEIYSVFRARDPGDRPNQNWFIGDSNSKDSPPIELVLEELDHLLDKHDWDGFLTRFSFLEEEINQWLGRSIRNLEAQYIDQWSTILAEEEFDKKLHYMSQVIFLRGLLNSLIQYGLLDGTPYNPTKKLELLMKPDESDLPLDATIFFTTVDELGIEERHGQSIRRAFFGIAKSQYDPKILKIVLKWIETEKVEQFESVIIKSCEWLNDPYIESVIVTLKRYGKDVQWQNVGPRLAKRMVRIRDKIPDEIFIRALQAQNGDTVLELMTIFDFDNRAICDAFVLLTKHHDERVWQKNLQIFLDEKEEQVSDYLSRLANAGSGLQQSAIRLLLDLCNAKEVELWDQSVIVLPNRSEFCEEIANLLSLSPKDTKIMLLKECLSNGAKMPHHIIEQFVNDKKQKDVEVGDLAWKVFNIA